MDSRKLELTMEAGTWEWVKSLSPSLISTQYKIKQTSQIPQASTTLPDSSAFGHSLSGVNQTAGAIILSIMVLLFLINIYMVFRIYKQKKFFHVYWIREYGPSSIVDANNGQKDQKEEKRDQKYKDDGESPQEKSFKNQSLDRESENSGDESVRKNDDSKSKIVQNMKTDQTNNVSANLKDQNVQQQQIEMNKLNAKGQVMTDTQKSIITQNMVQIQLQDDESQQSNIEIPDGQNEYDEEEESNDDQSKVEQSSKTVQRGQMTPAQIASNIPQGSVDSAHLKQKQKQIQELQSQNNVNKNNNLNQSNGKKSNAEDEEGEYYDEEDDVQTDVNKSKK